MSVFVNGVRRRFESFRIPPPINCRFSIDTTNHGDAAGGTTVVLNCDQSDIYRGSGATIVHNPDVSCRFGEEEGGVIVRAVRSTETRNVECTSPPGVSSGIRNIYVSNNGQRFTDTSIRFFYNGMQERSDMQI